MEIPAEMPVAANVTKPSDVYALSDIPERLPKEIIRELSVIRPGYFLGALALDIVTIAACVGVSEWSGRVWWIYLIAVIIIGARLHAFGVLMHEAAHHRAFNNRRVNDIMGEVIAWPIFVTMHAYRQNHFSHHRLLNTEEDPDWVRKKGKRYAYPASVRQLVENLLFYGFGVGFFTDLGVTLTTPAIRNIPRKLRIWRNVFYLGVIAASVVFGFWQQLILYWLIPGITSFILALYIRSVAEHHGPMAYDHLYTHSRTVLPYLWEKFLIAPHNIHYHLEHHLYPSVPFYNLGTLHGVLMQKVLYAKKAHRTRGYSTGLFKELTQARSLVPH